MTFKEKNLSLIKECYPRLLETYEQCADSPDVVPLAAKNSLPVFKYMDSAFHGIYKPDEEAARFAAEIPPDTKNIWVFGLGYGHHLPWLLSREAEIIIYEPSPEIFKSAVDNADMTAILDKCRIVIGNEMAAEIERASFNGARLFAHRPYLRFFEPEWNMLSSAVTARAFIVEKKPLIMVIGPIYGGSEPTFRFTADAFRKMGADTVAFDASKFAQGYWELEKATPDEHERTRLKESYGRMLGEAACAMARHHKPDLILAMAQAPLGVEALEQLKELGVPLAFWFVEDFRTMKYWGQAAPYYDYFFTIQRGLFFDKLKAAGAKNVAYLPQAAAPDSHRPVELTPEEKKHYGSDISFMGAGYHNRQIFFKGLLDYDFKIWGTEWNLGTELGKRVANRNERLKPEEYVKIFSASKINLNLHSSTLMEGIDPEGDFVNPRVFELAACGAFSLVDNRKELGALFKIGTEVVTYSSLSDLQDKINFYLANPEARQKVAEAARVRALTHHTFERRMESLLAFIVSKEGDTFPRKKAESKKASGNPRNIIANIIKEAANDPELVKFLESFDPDKEFDIKEITQKIKSDHAKLDGLGKVTKVESLMLILEEYTN